MLQSQLSNSLWWPIHVINSADNTKLPCYTLPWMQHHTCFSNLPTLFLSLKLHMEMSLHCNYMFMNRVHVFSRYL